MKNQKTNDNQTDSTLLLSRGNSKEDTSRTENPFLLFRTSSQKNYFCKKKP